MRLYNTLSGNIEELDTSKKIRIYLCGVTVYDDSHIGHARTIIVFDVLRRFLESKGVEVQFVQNFTDVDDKIINRARQEGVPASEISSRYIKNYFNDSDILNIKRATVYPLATQHIQDILDLIKALIEKNFAYVSKNGVYFDVSKFTDYGKLSKKRTQDLLTGVRIDVDEQKDDPLDFALWKFSDSDPCWDSPWGRGRPGWHIECSAMSLKYLGEEFDIHGGGRDLIFPHHENEIAQSEAITCKPFAKIWMHVGMVTIHGEKMSKSLGNIKTIKDALRHWGPNVIRLFCLSGHYSKPVDYSDELLQENVSKWRQVETAYYELLQPADSSPNNADFVTKLHSSFDAALEDDFNTHLALSAFFKLVKEINNLASKDSVSSDLAASALPEFQRMVDILGLRLPQMSKEEQDEINSLVAKRKQLRQEKQFQEADKIRDQITEMGIELVDHGSRTIWVKRDPISVP